MKLIMVDLDGTLIDTRKVNYLAYKEAVEPYGYKIDYDYYCNYCNGRHYLDFLPQITTFDSEIIKKIHERKKHAYKKYLEYARVNNLLVGILKCCRVEYQIALVTTASKNNTYEIMEKFKLTGLFDLIITNEDVTYPKPNPEGFIKAINYFKTSPEKCIIFEDSMAGIEAASRTGANIYIVKGYN